VTTRSYKEERAEKPELESCIFWIIEFFFVLFGLLQSSRCLRGLIYWLTKEDDLNMLVIEL
jgi:hypothetical protein